MWGGGAAVEAAKTFRKGWLSVLWHCGSVGGVFRWTGKLGGDGGRSFAAVGKRLRVGRAAAGTMREST